MYTTGRAKKTYRTLCNNPLAAVAIMALAAALGNKSSALAANLAATSLKISPTVDHPSASIKVSGAGFAANEAVDVYFDTTDELLAVTDGSGAFGSDPMPVPAGALPGTHWITAVGRKDDTAAQKAFTVRTDWPEIGLTAKGKRDNPYENVLNRDNVSALDTAWIAATGSNVNASPAVANGNVFVASNDHYLYAFNATTGAKLWSAQLGDYSNSSPAVADGAIYVGANDGKLYAFNVKTGAPLWTASTGAQIESSPAVAAGVVYVGSDDGNFYAFNATSGAKLWSANVGKAAASPAVANGVVYIDTLSSLFAFNASTGATIWQVAGTFNASPVVANGTVFVGWNGQYILALAAATGESLWSAGSGYPMTTAAVANGVVYAASNLSTLYAFNAGTGAILWTAAPVPALITSAPAVANGVVYLGEDIYADQKEGQIFAFDAANGTTLWSAAAGGYIQSSPAVANGMLYFGADDSNLYAFALDGGRHGAYRRNTEPPSPQTLQPDWRLKPAR